MKSVDAIQEVQVLPRATASHQPGSKTRWREATNVRSRVEQVSRVCIEPRKLFESRGPARDNHPRTPEPWAWEPRTVSAAGTQYRLCRVRRDRAEATGVVDQIMLVKGIARELVRASSASCLDNRGAVQSRRLCGESTA